MDTVTLTTSSFKVGDQVRLITRRHGDSPTNPVWDGKFSCVGTVTSMYPVSSDPLPVQVQWRFGHHNDYSVLDLAHHVESPKPVPAKPAPVHGIRVGDRVFLKIAVRGEPPVGTLGTVVSLESSHDGMLSARFDGFKSGYRDILLQDTYAVKPTDLRYYADAGEGYRILRDSETRLPTDEVINGLAGIPTWRPCTSLRLCSPSSWWANTVGERRAFIASTYDPRPAWTLQYRRKEATVALPAVQSYQSLGDNDIIQAGDEFTTDTSVDKWYRFGDSVGRTLAKARGHLRDLDGITIRLARRPAPTPVVPPATTQTAALRNGGTVTLDRDRPGLPLVTVRYSDGRVASANRYTDDELTTLATLLNQGTK